ETGYSYTYLSKIFSKQEKITIARYFILLKIEKVKELLTYGELSLGEIANMLQYSSVQALSNQFRKVTGYSVSEFREGLAGKRRPLDQIISLDSKSSE
ncbi:MAG: AraC family transcriptional regulator, partial [Bacteroidia bacterium]|nr:AraC family transcriptional regulator [Bacteroidia bacterium]